MFTLHRLAARLELGIGAVEARLADSGPAHGLTAVDLDGDRDVEIQVKQLESQAPAALVDLASGVARSGGKEERVDVAVRIARALPDSSSRPRIATFCAIRWWAASSCSRAILRTTSNWRRWSARSTRNSGARQSSADAC